MELADQARPRRRSRVRFEPLSDGCALYDVVRGRVHILNVTAAYVWSSCDGRSSLAAIIRDLGRVFSASGAPARQLEHDVRQLVSDLLRAGLLCVDKKPSRAPRCVARKL